VLTNSIFVTRSKFLSYNAQTIRSQRLLETLKKVRTLQKISRDPG